MFLAGDAAHAFPPSGGFGMNAGIVGRSATGDKTVHYRKGNESGTESHRSRDRFAAAKSPQID